MLNSVYSRIFYLCTIILMFCCALIGVIIVVSANNMHEKEAIQGFQRTAAMLKNRINRLSMDSDELPVEAWQTEMEARTLSENVDCYIFNANGDCLARSDYNTTEIELNGFLRMEAASEPYINIGEATGNFTEATATYVEQFQIGKETFYIMLLFPVAYLHEFSSKLLILLLITLIVTGILGAIVFYFNTTQVLKPLTLITRAAENYSKGDFSSRLPETNDPELGRLTDTMNRMADFIDKNERTRRRFVSDVSHELKTPITSIGGFVDNILDGTIPQKEQKRYLRIVSSEIQRLSRLVHSMLNISRFEEGTYRPNYERVDVTHLLIMTLLLFEEKIESKNVSVLGLDVCPKTLAEVDVDLIQQVFYNLTENAIKFVNKGGSLYLAVESDNDMVHVHLRNSGEGLTEEEIQHVFERFYKTDESRGLDTTGVGLGLSIVSRIMVLHNGKVAVKSVKGEYTEFVISVPLRQYEQ